MAQVRTAGAFVALAALLATRAAHGQAAGPSTAQPQPQSQPPPSSADEATDGAPPPADVLDETTVRPGVFRVARDTAVPVRFNLRSRGYDPVGVATLVPNGPAEFARGCSAPCTLWFDPGLYVIALGQTVLRTRTFALNVDAAPLEVRFTRDEPLGIAGGVALAGLGVVAMIIGVPLALSDTGNAAAWWFTAGSGLATLGGGITLSALSIGYVRVRAESAPR